MANFNNPLCNGCPYQFQRHLASLYHNPGGSPLSIEKGNDADILIVLQAPGEEEWKVGKPLQPTIKKGGTAGRRVAKSWEETGNERSSFDITNSVQCFPGKNGKRDYPPEQLSISKCYAWLKLDISNKNYSKAIVFGNIAFEQVTKALNELNINIPVVMAPHPNGGTAAATLNSIWAK